MKHNVYGKKLSRDKNQRTALFKALVRSLILSESISTTKAKAKAISGLVDKLITQAKSPSTKRLVDQFITDKLVSKKLFDDIVPKLKSRNSGYTSIIKLGFRQGDGAMMVRMSLLLDKLSKEKKEEAKKEENVN